MSRNPIIVVDYDPTWPQTFASLATILNHTLGTTAVAIHHVGSTSIPGLAAKPVIDIDVVVKREEMATAIDKLAQAGYTHVGDQGVPDREAFKQPGHLPAHHLYVCPEDSSELARHLTFCRVLRQNPDLRDEYGRLKQELALLYRDDRVAYTEAKSEFILKNSR